MKRLNYILVAGLSLVAAAACNKQLVPTDELEVKPGMPMTLTATISGPETKLGFTDESNVLKATWNANESISVITLEKNASGHMVIKTVDTFTTGSESDGKRTAVFKGTLSADATSEIRVFYPALEKTSDGNYQHVIPGSEKSLVYFSVRWMEATFNTDNVVDQSANGNLEHVGNTTILDGVGTVSSGGALAVELKPLTSVLRLDVTFPSNKVGYGMGIVELTVKDDSDAEYGFQPSATWSFYYFDGESAPKNNNHAGVYLDNVTIDATDFTVYIPIIPAKDVVFGPSGGKKIKVNCAGSSLSLVKTISLSSDTRLEPGKMYRLKVDYTE